MQDNTAPALDLLVVMPVYNEESNIASVIDQWCTELDKWGMIYAILALDDGSRDNTPEVLASLQKKWGPKVEWNRQANSGHGPTILKGYRTAVDRGVPWVLQIDSDDQCDPLFFPQLWQKRDGHDFVAGVRTRREDGLGRVAVSFILRMVVYMMSGVFSRDANVPYRLLRTKAFAPLLHKIPSDCFFTNVGLTVLAAKAKLRGITIPIVFRARHGGETTISYRKMGRHSLTLCRNLHEILKD